jgi:hypothetical protein
MALSFEQLAGLADDPIVGGRIRVAATRVAVDVAQESTTGSGGDVRYARRQALARLLLDQDTDGQAVLDRFVWGVIGQMPLAAAPTDAELQQIVTDVWDALAGVAPA